VKGRTGEDPETPASVHASQKPSLLVPAPVRHPLRDAVRDPHTRSPDPVSPLAASTPLGGRYRASPRIREVALRLPLDHGRRCCLPTAATRNHYEHPLLVDFPATSAEGLRHPRRAWRARCFTTPKPTGGDPRRCSEEAFLPPSVPLDRPPGAPVAPPIRGPDLLEEEPGCHSALAEDPRGHRRDRFRRRSVKTADFPDRGRLPPVSTLRGCSFEREALPPPLDPSSFLSSPATYRDRVRPLATPRRGSPRHDAS
jgi:hypothetical protein